MILTLIPLGIALLWLPAALWLFSQDQTGGAMFGPSGTGCWSAASTTCCDRT